MVLRKWVRFSISIAILTLVLVFIVVAVLSSAGLLDLAPESVINASENTTGVPEVSPSADPNIDGRKLEMEIFHRVNEQRTLQGREPFVHSERVRLIARLHSADMGNRGFYNHTNPDGLTPPDRHDKFGGCDHPNENLVEWKSVPTNDTQEIARRVVSTWSNSTGHNASMLTSYDKVTGVGVYVTGDRDLYVTQNFCREHPNA